MLSTPLTRSKLPGPTAVLFGLMIAAWFARTVFLAMHTPLWMDEVLTIWLLPMRGPAAIYDALARGAQYTPPAYPDLLYYWAKIAGTSYLSLRIPSIACGIVCATSVFVLVRRYLATEIAAVGFLLCLCPPFSVYNIQIRPYAPTLACLALTLLVWDDLRHLKQRVTPSLLARLGLIVCLIAMGLSLHLFYIFSVASLCVIELIFAIQRRLLRTPVWLALAAGSLTMLYWLPLIHQFKQFTLGDKGPLYAAAPKFLLFLVSLLVLSSQSLFFFLLLLLGAGLALAVRKTPRPSDEQNRTDLVPLISIALGMAAMPLVTFLVARFSSGIYTTRYALPGAFGAILLTCLALHVWALPARHVIIPAAVLLVSLAYLGIPPKPAVTTDLRPVFAAVAKPYPLALAEPLIFFAKEEDQTLSPQQRQRLVYYSLPSSFAFGDPTAERQVLRWKAINPALPVSTLQSVLGAHQCFYLYDTFQTDHDITRYLEEHSIKPLSVTHIGNGYLGEFCP